MTKSERVQVLLTPSERADLERVAKRENRSLAYVGRAFILDGVKRALLKGAKP